MRGNPAAVAQMFASRIPIGIRPLSIDLAISRVENVDLFMTCWATVSSILAFAFHPSVYNRLTFANVIRNAESLLFTRSIRHIG
jgi:hypothetical protein